MPTTLPIARVELLGIAFKETDHFLIRTTAKFVLTRAGSKERHDVEVRFDSEQTTTLEDMRRGAFDQLIVLLEEWGTDAARQKFRHKEND